MVLRLSAIARNNGVAGKIVAAVCVLNWSVVKKNAFMPRVGPTARVFNASNFSFAKEIKNVGKLN